MTDNTRREPRCGDVWVNPDTNVEVSGPEVGGRTVLRHYQCGSIEEAIDAWGGLKGEDAARSTAVKVVNQLLELDSTEIFEMFSVDGGRYLTFVFAANVSRGSAFVTYGHVDHYAATPGSVARSRGLRRSFLPTSRNVGKRVEKDGVVDTVLCPSGDQMRIKITATCSCGWSPLADDDDEGN